MIEIYVSPRTYNYACIKCFPETAICVSIHLDNAHSTDTLFGMPIEMPVYTPYT